MFSHCTVWYPALNPQGLKEQTVFSFDYFPNLPAMPIVSTALRDAAPDIENGPYPLVIYAHGSNDQRATNPYYVEHITSYGFVVMSINYEDNMGTWGQPLYPSLISRPADVTRQIDFAKTLTVEGGALAGMIDMDKIGVTGWSLGGFTALMAGNAQLDLEWMRREACSNPVFDPLEKCDETLDNVDHLVQLAGLEEAPEGTWPGMGDPRVDAIVPLAPAGRFIGEEGADADDGRHVRFHHYRRGQLLSRFRRFGQRAKSAGEI
jgi:predicted dienelactone hydrolase